MTTRRVLVLGAGMIARPLLRYFLAQRSWRVLVGTDDVPKAERLMGDHPRGRVVALDARDPAALMPRIAEAEVVVSLLPAGFNPAVARLCIAAGRPFVSTSYTAPEMRVLDAEARAAGVLILNEIGLDPGIDHMSAVSLIRRLEYSGGKVTRFESSCGGFPAQDANTNPWGYKFSWSPPAVMRAGRRPARYLREGREVALREGEIFHHSWPAPFGDQGVFEVYANRDSLAYIEPYGLQGVRGMFRGTLRYPGWCATMSAAGRLGLLDADPVAWPDGATYSHLVSRLLPDARGGVLERVADFLALDMDDPVVARLEWAGLFSDRPLPDAVASPIDTFGGRLARLMMYAPGERDLVMLKHTLVVTHPDGSETEVRSELMEHGDRWGDTAMSRTVALPAAIATRLILDDGISAVGVQIPTLREIYEPVLDELCERGIALHETHQKRFRGPLAPLRGEEPGV